jgi:hypothetical protein
MRAITRTRLPIMDDIHAAIIHDRAFGWGMRLALDMAAAGADERAREHADRLIADALRERAAFSSGERQP